LRSGAAGARAETETGRVQQAAGGVASGVGSRPKARLNIAAEAADVGERCLAWLQLFIRGSCVWQGCESTCCDDRSVRRAVRTV
jgi:hypothetical protein